MTAFDIQVDPLELSRVMANALAFWPAKSPVATGRLEIGHDTITATGTDTYTIGRDTCLLREPSNLTDTVTVELGREDWAAVERQARKGKGHPARLTYVPGDSLVFHPSSKTEAEPVECADMTGRGTTLVNGSTLESRDVWALCDELLTRLDVDGERLTFDPEYFGRFKKVKAPGDFGSEAVLDFVFQGDAEPMLAKYGPSFVGAIMPIDRVAYVAAQGEEAESGLW